jgi:hypothetical protein
MRELSLALLFVLFVTGCSDPIDRLSAKLSRQKDFELGVSVSCDLPASSTPTQVASNALRWTFINPVVTNFTIVEIRQVRISDSKYTALLADSNLGQKIVLFKLEHAFSNGREWDEWWSRVYDVK